jgi:hypothetical protein
VEKALYRWNGDQWLQQVSDFFVAEGAITNPVSATDSFASSLYLGEIK